jgi:hypothetical protein
MSIPSQIRYLKQPQIDKAKWDACIGSATHHLIYSYSWYLDAMTHHWDALVLNDYEAVMPLTWNKKYGFHYLYQPFFTAQLGITSNATEPLTDAFIKAIPTHFRFIEIALDENNSTIQFDPACRKRINMLLNLNNNYEAVHNGYHRLATRMIKRAGNEQLIIEPNADIKKSISFYEQQYNQQLKIKASEYEKLIAMFKKASLKNNIISLAAKQNGELLGMYILLQDENYVYSVIGGSSARGKENGAFYLLTDYAIQQACGTERQFRFEGSDLPGIAHFNQQFGAKPLYYNHLKINRLPFLLKVFRK